MIEFLLLITHDSSSFNNIKLVTLNHFFQILFQDDILLLLLFEKKKWFM